uniref:Non-specific serine/threonine protein kinase n=1 Tax=Medicago truncatula TaxID=3880 RepID=I3SSK2_MEDTR|nr:unknown [Medicago truncatula]
MDVACLMKLVLMLWITLITSIKSDPSDEACLTHLNKSLQDPNKSLENWNEATFSKPCNESTSTLKGILCNNGRIYKLSLNNLSLRGTISPFLSNCTNLQTLDLSSNFITGPIPPELQSLVNLAVLNLSSNRLEAIRVIGSPLGFRCIE